MPSWIRIPNPDPLTRLNPDPFRIWIRNTGKNLVKYWYMRNRYCNNLGNFRFFHSMKLKSSHTSHSPNLFFSLPWTRESSSKMSISLHFVLDYSTIWKRNPTWSNLHSKITVIYSSKMPFWDILYHLKQNFANFSKEEHDPGYFDKTI